jgi:hypothetical protein
LSFNAPKPNFQPNYVHNFLLSHFAQQNQTEPIISNLPEYPTQDVHLKLFQTRARFSLDALLTTETTESNKRKELQNGLQRRVMERFCKRFQHLLPSPETRTTLPPHKYHLCLFETLILTNHAHAIPLCTIYLARDELLSRTLPITHDRILYNVETFFMPKLPVYDPAAFQPTQHSFQLLPALTETKRVLVRN